MLPQLPDVFGDKRSGGVGEISTEQKVIRCGDGEKSRNTGIQRVSGKIKVEIVQSLSGFHRGPQALSF